MNAFIVTIGDELLIGQVVDTNSAWISNQLNLLGIQVTEIISISDNHQHIINTLSQVKSKTDLVIITGGLGPTRDDITKNALGEFMKEDLQYFDEVYNHICDLFQSINKPTTDIIKEQCYFPNSTEIIINMRGTAPGIWLKNDNLHILSMPGVPHEMKYIMKNGGLDKVKSLNTSPLTILHSTIKTAGIGEVVLAKSIDHIIDQFPENLSLAYLPSLYQVRLRLSIKGKNEHELRKTINFYQDQIIEVVGNKVYGFDQEDLPTVLGALLLKNNLTISTAESCTAGLIGHTIATIPGSSSYYSGGVVSYSNQIKIEVLHVNPQTLLSYGAVSEQCVKEMLTGLINIMNTDIGIAISGIAGPGGGSDEKPVGTTWIAYGSLDNIKTMKLQLGNDRMNNMEKATTAAINLVRLHLQSDLV